MGLEDDFFDLGGHSLAAVRLLMRVTEQYGIRIRLLAFYTSPTVSSVVQWIQAANGPKGECPAAHVSQSISSCTPYPLSYPQQWCWHASHTCEESPNLSFLGRIMSDVNVSLLHACFQHLVDSNPALRTVYPTRADALSQRCLSKLQVAHHTGTLQTP